MRRKQHLLLVIAILIYSLSAVVLAIGQSVDHKPETRLVRVEQRFIPATQLCSLIPGGELVEVVTSLQRHPETGTFWRWSPAAHHHRAAVRVIASEGAGSGVCIQTVNGACLVLTNDHVVGGSMQVRVSWPFGGGQATGYVIGKRPAGREDAAAILVQQPPEGWVGLPIAAATPPIGAELEMVAFGGPKYGQIRSFVAQRVNHPYSPLAIDAPTVSGDSGSGILYERQVVGLNYGGPTPPPWQNARSSSGKPIPLVYPASSGVNAEFLGRWLTQICGPRGCPPVIGGQYPNYPPQQSPGGSGGDSQFYPPNYSSPPAIPQPPGPSNPAIDVEKLKDEIIAAVIAKLPKPRDGKDGIDGRDGPAGPTGPTGPAGEPAVVDYDRIVSDVLSRLPEPRNGQDAVVDYDQIVHDVMSRLPKSGPAASDADSRILYFTSRSCSECVHATEKIEALKSRGAPITIITLSEVEAATKGVPMIWIPKTERKIVGLANVLSYLTLVTY